MNQATRDAIKTTRERLAEKYPHYAELAPPERRLLCMAYLADQVKVREVGGNNHGRWVGILLDTVGLDEGYAWCAAAMTFASMVAEAPHPLRSEGYNPAAVVGWRKWAEEKGHLIASPSRGSICMHKTTATQGHIGVCVLAVAPNVRTIEGNTSSGESGSQTDGGGLFRRTRKPSYWSWGFADV